MDFDVQKQSEKLQKTTIDSIKKLFPIVDSTKKHTLELLDVWSDDRLDADDYKSQFKAKIGERTWGVPVYGKFALVDANGKVVKKAEKIRLATVPKPTPRLSYIVGGKEVAIANQLRLRPAGYTVKSLAGGIKGQINLAKGYAGQIGLNLNPSTGLFRLKIGQANQRLYPILNALGVEDKDIAKAWGQEILDANKSITPAERADALKSFAKSVTGKTFGSPETASEEIRKFVGTTLMDPKINKRTVGTAYDKMDGGFLKDLSSRLIQVSRGEKDPHDRNSIEYKEYRTLDDLIEERLSMKTFKDKIVKKISHTITQKAGTDARMDDIINASAINPHIKQVFELGELKQIPDQLNPIDMLNTATTVTLMGPGGIQSEHTITDDMRNVHPSHLGYLDPVHTPETSKVGVVYHLPLGVSSKNKTLLTRAINVKTGKLERIGPDKFADSVVAFPDQYDSKAKRWKNKGEVMVLGKENKTLTVKSSEVDYILQSPKQVFSVASNMIPFLPNNMGGRTLVASKLAEQAVPLKHREQPLVQSKLGGNVTMEQFIGDAFSMKAPVGGIVSSVTKDAIVVKDNKGQKHTTHLYNNFPLNKKSFIESSTKVAKGDIVKPGQLLADTNFTDDGVLAIGKNLRTAYVPYKGLNFEDGIVITDDAAKKLTSEHMHVETATEGQRFKLDRASFAAEYPNAYSRKQIETLNKDGTIRKGAIVMPGDPIIARLRKDEIDPENVSLGRLSRTLMKPWRDDSIKWDGDTPGKVVDVIKQGNKVKVYIKTEEPAQIGDKLVGRFGNKGIITSVIPAEQAPHTTDGQPADILFNPHGIITRVNIGQVLENAASKAALIEGKPYVVDNFSGENYTDTVKKKLAKHGITDTEEMIDPLTGKSMGKVNVGNTYVFKLAKQARSQFSARGAGPGWKYSQHTKEPLKGGETGSKALDLLTLYSMLAHGSRANLREMATYKASRNDEFWNALKTGNVLPPPAPTFSYNKFISYMKGAGVDVKQDGTKLVLAPMTDKEVLRLSNGTITDSQFVRAKDLKEIRGGLMDRKVTGGITGEKWAHIDLAEPVVNSIFEAPVKSLLGLNRNEYSGLVGGRLHLDAEGALTQEETGVTGGKAVKAMLKKLDLDAKLTEFRDAAKKARSPSAIDKANRGIRYIEALKRFDVKPDEAYVLSKVPVLPPVYRPVYALPDGNLHTSGLNYLYRDLGLVNDQLKAMNKIPYMPESAKQDMRKSLHEGLGAIAGLNSPITFYPKNRPVRGIVSEIKGVTSPKTGFFQRHVLRREQDLVGRGTIIPEPKLGVDEVGLPNEMAWTIFQPFVMRELVNQGYNPIDADKEIEDKGYVAKQALDAVMRERPVMLNRAPSLHKFSVMAFKPQLTAGRAIKIPPLIVNGFNADFDGDTMQVHVPIMPDAVEEAKKMLPSRNLYNPGTGGIMMAPSQESNIGLYFLSQTKEGQSQIDEALPSKYRGRKLKLDKGAIRGLLTEISKNDPKEYAGTVEKLTRIGNEESFLKGFTVSIDDVQPNIPEKDAILAAAAAKAKGATDAQKIKIYQSADKKIKSAIKKRLDATGNNLYKMVASGSRGNMDQLKQIVSAPLLVEDVTGATLPIPVTQSFSKGLDIGQYWNSLYGARRGVVNKQQQTADPGAFNKDLMATVVRNVVSVDDCGTSKGLDMPVGDLDSSDRLLANDIVVGSKTVARRGSLVTPNLFSALKKSGVKNVSVRSPLTCRAPQGTCSKCSGLTENGIFPKIGDNIGAVSGQSLTEPLTQMVLRSMHTGGVAGAQKLTGFEKVDKLVKMPKVIAGKATLAEHGGKITSVEAAPAGGKNVFIGATRHFVEPGNPLKVRIGSRITKGDAISEGIVQPRELVNLKGMLNAQRYLVDEITSAYRDTGFPLRKKNVETVVRSLADTTRVVDGGDSPFQPGDIASFSEIESFNESAVGKMDIEAAIGRPVFKDHGPVKKGTTVNKKVSRILRGLGYSDVAVGPEPVVHEPFLDGVKELPMLRKDWISQMGYTHIAKGIMSGASESWESDIHGFSPIPAFAYGAEFGKGKGGRY